MKLSGTARFDQSGAYRYLLTRVWDSSGPRVTWVMLNPSTATANSDDNTIRRVIGFSRSWGFGSAVVVNLFGYRATRPAELRCVDDPVGPGNDIAILDAVAESDEVVAAWGNHGTITNPSTGVPRSTEMEDVLGRVTCLGLTEQGEPRHPLYVSSDTRRVQLT